MKRIFDRDQLLLANQYFHLNDARLRDLLSLCDSVSGDELLQQQASGVHDYFFHSDLTNSQASDRWKTEPAFIGSHQAGFAALLVISGLEHMRTVYQQRGIPDAILCDSLKDMTIWMDHYQERTGKTGLEEVVWLLNSLRGTLFRLGRFQFIHESSCNKACMAVHKADGMAVAFFQQPETIRADGLADGTNGIFDHTHSWQTSFEMTDDEIIGTPLHPGGFAIQKTLRLPRSQWELVLQAQDGVLDLHIPKDGKMDLDQCRDSILTAMKFFDRYFPDKPYKAIHLETWFLDNQLPLLLPAHSNIVRFQREFCLLPTEGDHKQTYERVFGDSKTDISKAPEDTVLQRTIKSFVLAGNQMHNCAGILLPQHMGRFGTAWYQTSSAKALESLLQEIPN